ncbi:MAG: hypothetical protein TYPL_1750 [Candidatus Tyloplasma litorale]|nr:MAG: hypothetical protein TYPL_1750 [Mycoplasmatales bacterium]
MKTNENIFLTGKAGTGKTTTIKRYLQWARENNKVVALTASTGVAALHIGGTTIHSFLGSRIAGSIEEYKKTKFNKAKLKQVFTDINDIDVLIVDEVSMLNASFIDMMDFILKIATQSDLPFGGIKVIFVGDFLQLPPVGKTKTEQKPAFMSKAWKKGKIKVYNLTKVHRQDDNDFIKILSRIRHGDYSEEIERYFDDVQLKPFELPKNYDSYVKLYARNINVDNYNNERLERINGPSKTYYAQVSGKDPKIEKELIKRVLTSKELKLKVGAQVMILNNDEDKNYVNGSIGIVIKLGNDFARIRLNNGTEHNIRSFTWKAYDAFGEEQAKFEQIPLKLAYAITIHKSQGMTIEKAVIDCDGIFEKAQFYVAISRVKSKKGLLLDGFDASKHIIIDRKALEFYNQFENIDPEIFYELDAKAKR